MMAEYSVNDPSWLELVGSDPKALPFHHPAWTLLLAESYAFKPLVLGRADETGRLIAGMPIVEVAGLIRGRRWVSLPFTDLCPPLVSDACLDLLQVDIDRARSDAGVASLEVRARLPGARPTEHPALLHDLPLTADPERVAASFRASVRRNIRTAEKGPWVCSA